MAFSHCVKFDRQRKIIAGELRCRYEDLLRRVENERGYAQASMAVELLFGRQDNLTDYKGQACGGRYFPAPSERLVSSSASEFPSRAT